MRLNSIMRKDLNDVASILELLFKINLILIMGTFTTFIIALGAITTGDIRFLIIILIGTLIILIGSIALFFAHIFFVIRVWRAGNSTKDNDLTNTARLLIWSIIISISVKIISSFIIIGSYPWGGNIDFYGVISGGYSYIYHMKLLELIPALISIMAYIFFQKFANNNCEANLDGKNLFQGTFFIKINSILTIPIIVLEDLLPNDIVFGALISIIGSIFFIVGLNKAHQGLRYGIKSESLTETEQKKSIKIIDETNVKPIQMQTMKKSNNDQKKESNSYDKSKATDKKAFEDRIKNYLNNFKE
ncbi:MAG: hypothetical protein ACTSWY_08805 [Promethearchaeota archaeon]